MIDAILTDVGGVLIQNYDVSPDIKARSKLADAPFKQIWNEAIEAYGSGLITEEQMWDIFKNAGSTPITPEENLLGTPFEANLRIYPKVLSLLQKMSESDYTIAILSNTNDRHEEVLRRHGVYDIFGENVFLSNKIGLRKPKVEAFQYVLEALKIDDPSRVLFIDDQEKNIPPALSLGMKAILVKDDEESIIDTIKETLRNDT